MYRSESQLLVERGGAQLRSDVPRPVGSTSTKYLYTQASMITSREVVAAALRDPNVLTLPTLRTVEQPIDEVIRTLSASVGKNTGILSVTAESAYPEDAAQIVNAVVRAYERWHETNKQLSTADLLSDLNTQLEKRYQELRTKRQERMVFEQRNPKVVESSVGGLGSKTLDLLKQDFTAARVNSLLNPRLLAVRPEELRAIRRIPDRPRHGRLSFQEGPVGQEGGPNLCMSGKVCPTFDRSASITW